MSRSLQSERGEASNTNKHAGRGTLQHSTAAVPKTIHKPSIPFRLAPKSFFDLLFWLCCTAGRVAHGQTWALVFQLFFLSFFFYSSGQLSNNREQPAKHKVFSSLDTLTIRCSRFAPPVPPPPPPPQPEISFGRRRGKWRERK